MHQWSSTPPTRFSFRGLEAGGTTTSGQRDMIPTLAKAAVAAGCDALFVEVHPDPDKALSDGPNSLRLDDLEPLLRVCLRIRQAVEDRPASSVARSS